MFDTHCHLNFKRFKKNVDEVIARAQTAGVTHIVIPGTDVKRSQKAVELAGGHEHFYGAVGIHPHHAFKLIQNTKLSASSADKPDPESRQEQILNRDLRIGGRVQDDIDTIESFLSHPKVVAVGEVGMDMHVYENTKYAQYGVSEEFIEIQRELFQAHIALAIKHDKSLILHNREATDELVRILKKVWSPKLAYRTVLHCCEADERLFNIAQEHHMFIGVDGDVTYDKQKQEFVKKVPIEMLVLETDSPYILPEPLRSQKKYPNEPANLAYIAQAVADIKDMSPEKVVRITTENGKKLFAIS